MLWQHYVFRRAAAVHEMWDQIFESRPLRLLYIAGRGFDVRAQAIMRAFVESLRSSNAKVEKADLLLVGFSGYELSDGLHEQTEINSKALEETFANVGSASTLPIGTSAAGEDDLSAANALRIGTDVILGKVTDQTDVVLDVSSLPRIVYLSILTALLHRLIPDKGASNAMFANGVNLQVFVAEDPALDGRIRSEDPRNELVLLPGFSSALQAESMQDWPLVWFPILGENRVAQLEKVMESAIPDTAEVCPVLPHPSRDPRRADQLLLEYKLPLFDKRQTPMSNILYAHESNPFEAYRQLLGAMQRYRESMRIIGGCRLVVTPLASKLITLGTGLACFEMRPATMDQDYGVAIPYCEPTRYVASTEELRASKPEIAALLLTGDAYNERAS